MWEKGRAFYDTNCSFGLFHVWFTQRVFETIGCATFSKTKVLLVGGSGPKCLSGLMAAFSARLEPPNAHIKKQSTCEQQENAAECTEIRCYS